jgi:hypothetical protein
MYTIGVHGLVEPNVTPSRNPNRSTRPRGRLSRKKLR